jgi:hypothetical protein
MAWYTSGTVAVTNGSTSVIGTGTQFITNTKAGDIFICLDDGLLYEIDSIVSATEITLKRPYAGTANAQAAYEIVPTTANLKTLAQQVTDLVALYTDVSSTYTAARDAALAAQAAAQTAETAAETAQGHAADSATASANSAAAALASQQASKTSETNAASSVSAVSSTASRLATLSGKNRIINGDFRVAQRAQVTNSDSGWLYGQPDRWAHYCSGTGGALLLSQTVYGYAGVNSTWGMATITKVPTNAFTGTNLIIPFNQRIEAFNAFDLCGGQVTLTFKFRASVAGAYPVTMAVFDGAATPTTRGYYHTSFQYTTPGAVQLVTITTPAIPYLINPGPNRGLDVTIGAINVGQYQCPDAAINTWNAWSSPYQGGYTVSGGVNWATAVNNYVMVTDVQIEAGSAATLFDRRPFGAEFALCQRYYQVLTASHRFLATAANQLGSSSLGYMTAMRASPSYTGGGNSGLNLCSAVVFGVWANNARIEITSSGAGDCYALGVVLNLTCEL